MRLHLRSTTFLLFAVTLVTLAVAHHLAMIFYLYWTYFWLDSVMHFLGGAAVALGFLTVTQLYVRKEFWAGLLMTVGVVLVVGAIWEIFEFTAGISVKEQNFRIDTISDFIFNVIGGICGYTIARVLHPLDHS